MICRLCLCCEGLMNSIFDMRLQICEKIKDISSLEIVFNDGLPGTICASCTEKVELFHSFKKQIEKSNDTLKEWIGADILKNSKHSKNLTKKPIEEINYVELSKRDNQMEMAPRIVQVDNNNAEDLKYSCLVCLEDFTSKGEVLISHAKSHFENKGKFQNRPPFKCELCSQSFEERLTLVVHQRVHLKIKPFKCSQCERNFSGLNMLIEHRKNTEDCTDASLIACDNCGDLFKSVKDIEEHKLTHFSSNLKCELCEKQLLNIRSYRLHVKYHATGKQFTCTVCSKSYFTKSQLKKHSYSHEILQPHLCPICGNSFPTESELNRHLTYHNKIKVYKCKYCSVSFYETHHLKEHLKLKHINESSFVCEHCGKKFTSENLLKKHAKNHSNISLQSEANVDFIEKLYVEEPVYSINEMPANQVFNVKTRSNVLPEYIGHDLSHTNADLNSGIVYITDPSNVIFTNDILMTENLSYSTEDIVAQAL